MKHEDAGPPYPPEVVFVGVGAIYRLNQSWPHSSTIHVLDRVVGELNYVGKHRLCKYWPEGTRYFMASGNLRNCGGVGDGAYIASANRPVDVGDAWD